MNTEPIDTGEYIKPEARPVGRSEIAHELMPSEQNRRMFELAELLNKRIEQKTSGKYFSPKAFAKKAKKKKLAKKNRQQNRH